MVDDVDGAVAELEVISVRVAHIHVGRQRCVHRVRGQWLRGVHLHSRELDIRESDLWVPKLEDRLAQGKDRHREHDQRWAEPFAAEYQPPLQLR